MAERTEKFTESEIARMRIYEEQTGKRIIYTFDEKCQVYRTHPTRSLENASYGISRAIAARWDPENDFDGPDEGWKLKLLQDNAEAIRVVLDERKTQLNR